MISNSKIAFRYAKALFDLAQENKETGHLAKDMSGLAEVIRHSDDLGHFLKNPVIPVAKQQSTLEALFRGKVTSLTERFLIFLAEKKKLRYLEDICTAFQVLYFEFSGILEVTLASAVAMRPDQVKTICEKLKNHFQKEIHAHQEVKPELLGGFQVQVGDLIYDFTIRTQLERFRRSVMTTV